ncbi:MAG: 50S ribosomal protein L16 [Candidatus Niyogibacteria bacterium]|nr:50S ribosomal protein L16 [Candidatus Niyogibacteria bacterium]
MLFQKILKYRKFQRLRGNQGKTASRGTTLAFGSAGLQAEDSSEINSRQIEAARKAITRFVQKGGKLWIRIFPDKPVTAKPPEVGMGKGKGDPDKYVADVGRGRILFEVDGISEADARTALRRAGAKLPIRTKVVMR